MQDKFENRIVEFANSYVTETYGRDTTHNISVVRDMSAMAKFVLDLLSSDLHNQNHKTTKIEATSGSTLKEFSTINTCSKCGSTEASVVYCKKSKTVDFPEYLQIICSCGHRWATETKCDSELRRGLMGSNGA